MHRARELEQSRKTTQDSRVSGFGSSTSLSNHHESWKGATTGGSGHSTGLGASSRSLRRDMTAGTGSSSAQLSPRHYRPQSPVDVEGNRSASAHHHRPRSATVRPNDRPAGTFQGTRGEYAVMGARLGAARHHENAYNDPLGCICILQPILCTDLCAYDEQIPAQPWPAPLHPDPPAPARSRP